MRIEYLQHAAFEEPANLAVWAKEKGHTLSGTLLHEGAPLPESGDFDWLWILGGPMSVRDEGECPWLRDEKTFIAEAVRQGKRVLGICLGAQLLAAALGGKVRPCNHKEIGWHPVRLSLSSGQCPIFRPLPRQFTAFHWHGETFDLPEGARHLAESAACRNQAFVHGACAFGLQFHLEATPQSIERLVRHCPADLAPGPFVQSAKTLASAGQHLKEIKRILWVMLDLMAEDRRA